MKMNKTLLALALATATVSGSAMAWQSGDFNGSFDLGGVINVPRVDNPWEVSAASAVTNFNYQLTTGESSFNITVPGNIPVLGIRTVRADFFNGGLGISPQVSYNNSVDFAKASNGIGTLSLDVLDSSNSSKIGTMTVPFYAGAGYASANKADGSNVLQGSLYAPNSGNAFFGGVPTATAKVDAQPWVTVAALDPEYVANFQNQNASVGMFTNTKTSFNNDGLKYTAFYGSGIKAGANVSISLDKKLYADTNWKASLPITVSYM